MSRVLFCDWNDAPEKATQTTLFELTDLSEIDVVFFNPLEFAVNAGFRTNTGELYKTEYFPYSEDELRTYVANVKLASEILRDFVISGGIFVIRSAIPKSYIKVTKKSIVGVITNKYTESIVSIFYWLEEFLGRFACEYGMERSFTYLAPRSRIYKAFGQTSAESVCAVTLNRAEFQYVIAESAHEPYHPLIYTVSGKNGMGETYIIPKFLVKNESERLAEVFDNIHKNKTGGIDYPFWVERYEQRLNKINPFNRQVIDIDKEIQYLKNKRATLFQESEDIRELLRLVYGSAEDLHYAVKKAFEILGFQFPTPPESIKAAGYDLYMRCGTTPNIVADIYASDKYAVSGAEFVATATKLETIKREDKPKVILVANAANVVVPNKREREFEDEVLAANLLKGFCLLSSVKLFDLACTVFDNLDSPNLESMKEAIRRDILESTGEYEANTRKYLAVTTV